MSVDHHQIKDQNRILESIHHVARISCLTSRVLWKLKAIDGAMEAWSDDMI